MLRQVLPSILQQQFYFSFLILLFCGFQLLRLVSFIYIKKRVETYFRKYLLYDITNILYLSKPLKFITFHFKYFEEARNPWVGIQGRLDWLKSLCSERFQSLERVFEEARNAWVGVQG